MQKAEYPANHQPGMKVPKGGSSCSSCEYLGPDGNTCSNEYFIRWHGSENLPAPADEYCSDWYEPAKKDPVRSPHGFLPLSELKKPK